MGGSKTGPGRRWETQEGSYEARGGSSGPREAPGGTGKPRDVQRGIQARTIRPDHCLGRFPVKPFRASRITKTPEQLHMAKTVPKQHS